MSYSVRSGGSRPSYRKVSRNSNVDETLFASSHQDSASRLRREIAEGKKFYPKNKDGVRGMKIVDPGVKKATIIRKSVFDSIARRSQILTQAERDTLREKKEQERLIKMAKAEARKERMRQLELDRKNTVVKTEEEKDDEIQLNASLSKAADQRVEQIDQVKTMRRKMMYAQCAKIREVQIQAKRDLADQSKAYAERQDIMMEIDRLKKIKSAEEEEGKKGEIRRKDAQEIRRQIEHRQRMKILEDERVEQEKLQMKATIKVQEAEDVRLRKEKSIAGKLLLEEVLQANTEAIGQKLKRKEQEREDDERILKWQMEKRAQEEKVEAEKAAFKAAQDRQFYEVASKMKRSQDNRSEEDALRAKRHQQEMERKERERERKQRSSQKDRIMELMEARKRQASRKVEDLKVLAMQDKLEWDKINRENSEIQAKHDEVLSRQQRENLYHQKALREQMKVRERMKEEERAQRRKEGEKLRRENNAFLKQIEKKKKEILQEMRNGDIPDKFCAEVEMMKIELQ